MKFDWKDFWIRCFKTFLEAALGYISTVFAGINFGDGSLSDTVIIGFLITGAATGFTAVINGVILPLLRTKTEPKECEEE